MSEIKHGTSHAYQRRGCRCELCRAWSRLYAKERRFRKANPGTSVDFFGLVREYGEEYRQYVPADIAIEVVRRMKDELGVTLADIARQAECDYLTIHNFYHGKTRNNTGKIKWETAARIYGAEGWFEAEREVAHDGA